MNDVLTIKEGLVSQWNHNIQDITNNQVLRLNWNIGNTCTYKCSYCPDYLNNGTIKWVSLERMIKITDKIIELYKTQYNKNIFIFELTGGEPTVYPYINEFSTYLKSKNIYVQLVTNGSRSLRWWEEYGINFTSITLSYHVEFTDVDHVINVCNLIDSKGISASVLMIFDPQNYEKVKFDLEYMKSKSNFSIHIRKVENRGSSVDRSYSYTKEQLEFLESNYLFTPITRKSIFPKEIQYRTIYIKDNQSNRVDENTLWNTPQNNFKGWNCYAGIDTLNLDIFGNIIAANCNTLNSSLLGNWRTDDIDKLVWPKTNVVCQDTGCVCVHDIRARKVKY